MPLQVLFSSITAIFPGFVFPLCESVSPGTAAFNSAMIIKAIVEKMNLALADNSKK
ncbi:MAG: hypothetical protein GY785_19725 [Gammaproteobacteria bacterium]|nr:hypothetical protein [Gammaproteobacteria bacterium]